MNRLLFALLLLAGCTAQPQEPQQTAIVYDSTLAEMTVRVHRLRPCPALIVEDPKDSDFEPKRPPVKQVPSECQGTGK